MSELAILDLLRARQGQWLTMSALQAALGLPPARIRRSIEQACRHGCEIETSPVQGFRLLTPADRLNADLIEFGLDTRRIGNRILVYETTDSTNDVAWQYGRSIDYDGLAIFAEQQRRGRGRMGNCWLAPGASSILCSVLLLESGPVPGPTAEPVTGPALTLLAGLVVALALENSCHISTRIKWPNDVMIDGRKVAGTIVESRSLAGGIGYVMGFGINCCQQRGDFTPELRDIAVSLQQVCNRDVDRIELARELLRRLDDWLAVPGVLSSEKLHRDWLSRCDDIGRRITVVSDSRSFTGRIIDVSPTRGLLLQSDSGAIRIFDGATTSVKRD